MAFEEFENQKRLQGHPMVSIFKYGVISVNKSCEEKYFKGCDYATFLFDEANHKIGIRPTTEPTGKSSPIRRGTKGVKYCFISARKFLNHYKILPDSTKAYACSWNSKEKLLEINLKEK